MYLLVLYQLATSMHTTSASLSICLSTIQPASLSLVSGSPLKSLACLSPAFVASSFKLFILFSPTLSLSLFQVLYKT